METVQTDPLQPEARTRFGRTVRAPKRYVPIETPLDDYSDDETDDMPETDEGHFIAARDDPLAIGPGRFIACGDPRPFRNRKRRRHDSESDDEDSDDESDTGSDLKGFIVDDDEEDEDYQESGSDEPEELFDSDADSDY